ncbi:MAG TPA: hypothetical protein VFG67_00660 [Oleiagrimonas sp.]|nr:hypothetical protein [Oleiagrimonas sp.]
MDGTRGQRHVNYARICDFPPIMTLQLVLSLNVGLICLSARSPSKSTIRFAAAVPSPRPFGWLRADRASRELPGFVAFPARINSKSSVCLFSPHRHPDPSTGSGQTALRASRDPLRPEKKACDFSTLASLENGSRPSPG